MWTNDRPTAPGFYWCHQRGNTRIVHIWCYKNGTELFTNEDGGASIKDTLYDGTQWMAAVNPPNPQDQNESAQPAPGVPTPVLVAIADLVAQMEVCARAGFVDMPDDKDSCAAFCVAEGAWLELMSCVGSLAKALAAAAPKPETKP